MNPEELLYCETHEWVRLEEAEGAKVATIGITAYAVEQLSDVVGLELPEVGRTLTAGEEFGVAESVKAVSPLYCPVDGEIIAVNKQLEEDFESLNEDPYGRGWIIRVRLTDETSLSQLMDRSAYEKQCAEEG